MATLLTSLCLSLGGYQLTLDRHWNMVMTCNPWRGVPHQVVRERKKRKR